MGEEYSVADAYLFTLTRWLKSDGGIHDILNIYIIYVFTR